MAGIENIKPMIGNLYKKLQKAAFSLKSIPYPAHQPEILNLLAEYNRQRQQGPRKHFCYVPMNNIVFGKNGKVLACNYNQEVVLGVYPNNTLSEILNSEQRKKLIKKHLQNDLSFGCEYCAKVFETKKYSCIKPSSFDKYSNGFSMNKPKVMEFEIDSYCNLKCITCNEKNRDTEDDSNPYDEQFIKQISPYFAGLKEAKFYGGEPFLIKQYQAIWKEMVAVNPKIKIFVITNGTILTSAIKDILNKGIFEIGVSIDSTEKTIFEEIRVNASFEKVMENLKWFSEYCCRKKTTLNISMTIIRRNWRNIPDIIHLCNKINATVYFSYLYNPESLSLWTLEKDKINEIISFLANQQIPAKTSIEKYNYSCYQDIIKQLQLIETKQILVHDTEVYFKNPLNELTKRISDYYQDNCIVNFELKAKTSIERITSLLADTSSNENISVLLQNLLKIPVDKYIHQIEKKPDVELVELAKKWINHNQSDR